MINQVDLAEAKVVWDRAYKKNPLHVPFFTHLWHTNWKEILGAPFQPMYLIIDDEIMAPFVTDGEKAFFSGGEEIGDYLDIIGPEEKKQHAWQEIIAYLKNRHIPSVSLRNVPENSPTVSFFRNQPSAKVEKEDTTPKLAVPDSWEKFIESLDRKSRHELERKIRKFEREHVDTQVIESDNVPNDIDKLLTLMEKDPDKKAFLTPDMKTFFKKTAVTFAEHISLLFVTMGDKTAASTFSFVEDNNIYLYNSGFDKECCANAGFYLKAINVKRAIENRRVEYNFLQGDERYKYELGGKDFLVYSIQFQL